MVGHGEDSDGYAAFFAAARGHVMNQISVVTGRDYALAEDAVQDAFSVMFLKWGELASLPYPALVSYATQTATFKVSEILRRTIAQRRRDTNDFQRNQTAFYNVEEDVIMQEEPEILRGLSDRERQVARLLIEGLKPVEIAERLELAPSTVRSYVGRIRDRIVASSAEVGREDAS